MFIRLAWTARVISDRCSAVSCAVTNKGAAPATLVDVVQSVLISPFDEPNTVTIRYAPSLVAAAAAASSAWAYCRRSAPAPVEADPSTAARRIGCPPVYGADLHSLCARASAVRAT